MNLRYWGYTLSLLAILVGCNPFKGNSSADGGSGWPDTIADIAGSVILDADEGMLFHGYDTLTYPETETELRVLVQKISRMSGVPGLTVTFYDDDDDEVGSVVTNSDGIAKLPFIPPAEGDYAFTAKITDVTGGTSDDVLDIDPTPILVVARNPEAKFLVVDLDHTVVKSGFDKVLTGGAKPMPRAKEVLQRLQDELDYNVIYLTHRPALMTRKSKEWIIDQGLPTGPLLASQLSDITDNEGYKAQQIATLKERFPDIRLGVGDKVGDAKAYLSNGMAAFLIPYVKEGSDSKNLYEQADEIDDIACDDLFVVTGWKEIEVAIFSEIEVKCPAEFFTRRLRLQADLLAGEEAEDDEDDEEDEDD